MRARATLSTQQKPNKLIGLTLAAIGIVYRDIGTSSLYSLKTGHDNNPP